MIFRVPAAVKARFQEAAEYTTGGDLTAFLVAAGLERANQVLAQRGVLEIDDTTRALFHAAMRSPARPSATLRRLVAGDHSNVRAVK